MQRTAMPEAAVDENRNPRLAKDKVRLYPREAIRMLLHFKRGRWQRYRQVTAPAGNSMSTK
jgi:hypothetical protein